MSEQGGEQQQPPPPPREDFQLIAISGMVFKGNGWNPVSDPPDPREDLLFAVFVVEGIQGSSEPMCPIFLN
eukprot:1157639-Pelagomonas_calceolata.AAC.3